MQVPVQAFTGMCMCECQHKHMSKTEFDSFKNLYYVCVTIHR